MRVLFIAPQPFFEERGTPIAVRLIVEELCSLGHSVDLLTYHQGSDIQIPGARQIRAGRPPGVRHVPIGISPAKLICDVWLIKRMLDLLRAGRYDVIHAVEESVFPAAACKGFARAKLVYDMDSSLADQLTDKWTLLRPLGGLWRAIERWAVRRSDAVLPVCEDLAVKVRPWALPQSVTVLPDVPVGSATDASGAESLQPLVGSGNLLALYVGNLERYQGIHLMLEGFARARSKEKATLVVIGGSAQDIATYREMARSLGIEPRVHFLGPRPVAQLPAYLQQADILVSPRTLGQNTPMKVYSYMQAGKAILATDIRSHTQALDPDCAALVAPQADAVAAGFDRLIADADYRAKLGAGARAKVEREYSMQVFKKKVSSVYAQLEASRLADPGKAPAGTR